MYKLHELNVNILKQLDLFIDLLLKNKILIFKSNTKQLILKFNHANYIFSTFVQNHISWKNIIILSVL